MYKNDYLRMYEFDHYFDILLTNLEETGLFCKRIVAFFKRNGDIFISEYMDLSQKIISNKYSQARLENACKLALSRLSNPTYKNIRLILESGQDKTDHENKTASANEDITYAFTRGAEYYGGKK